MVFAMYWFRMPGSESSLASESLSQLILVSSLLYQPTDSAVKVKKQSHRERQSSKKILPFSVSLCLCDFVAKAID